MIRRDDPPTKGPPDNCREECLDVGLVEEQGFPALAVAKEQPCGPKSQDRARERPRKGDGDDCRRFVIQRKRRSGRNHANAVSERFELCRQLANDAGDSRHPA